MLLNGRLKVPSGCGCNTETQRPKIEDQNVNLLDSAILETLKPSPCPGTMFKPQHHNPMPYKLLAVQ